MNLMDGDIFIYKRGVFYTLERLRLKADDFAEFLKGF